MLEIEMTDFSHYSHELKDNYRKGIHRLKAILETPILAEEFANNLGAASVIFGTPIDQEDRNSKELRDLVVKSGVCHLVANSFISANGYAVHPSLDVKFAHHDVCLAVTKDPQMYRACRDNDIAIGKLVAGLAELAPEEYEGARAVAASSTAMAAVAASSLALNQICKNTNARAQFNASSYRDSNYAAILKSCQDSTYFNTTLSNGTVSSGNNSYWCSYDAVNGNRLNNAGSNTSCIVLVAQLYYWGNYNYTATTTNGYNLWTNSSYGSGTWHTINKVAMGGFKYYGTQHRVYAFTPK